MDARIYLNDVPTLMKILPAAVAACFLLFPSVHADEEPRASDPIDAQLGEKLKADPSTTGQIHAFQAATQSWETEMTRLLDMLRKRLPSRQRDLLKNSQRDWLAFRDSEELLRISFNAGRHGTMVGLFAVEARAMFLHARVLTLRHYEENSRGPGEASR